MKKKSKAPPRASETPEKETSETAKKNKAEEEKQKLLAELETLKKTESKFRSLIEQGPSVTYSVNYFEGEGVVSYVSPQIASFLGVTPEEWIATPGLWEKHIHPFDRERIIRRARESCQKGERFCEEYRMTSRDGKVKWVHDESAIIRDSAGAVVDVRGSWYDITGLRRAQETRNVFTALGRRLNLARTPRDVGMIAAETADALLGWDAFYINMYSEEEGVAHSVINIDTIDNERREFPSIYNKPTEPSPMFKMILKEGAKLILREKPEEDSSFPLLIFRENPRRSGSLMFVPIRERGEKIIGQMSVQSYSFGAYGESDLALFQNLADHCSGALERAFAEEKLHLAEERASAFATLAYKLNSVHAAHEAALIIAEVADQILGWDACNINIYDSEMGEMRSVLNIDTIEDVKTEVPLLRGDGMTPMTQKVLREGAQLILRDSAFFDKSEQLVPFGDVSRPSRSLMFVPVRKGENVVGTINIQGYAPFAYSKADLETLQAFADHCSGALERIQAERSLVEERNLLSVMLDNLPQYVYIKDAQSRFVAANRHLWSALGLNSLEEIIGKTDSDFSTGEEAERALKGEREIFETGRPILDKKISFVSSETGRIHWLSINKIPLRNQDGKITGLLGFNIEYTDQKRMEDQQTALIRLGRELSAASTPGEAGKIIVDIAQELIGWDSCFVLLYHNERNYIQPLFGVDTIDGEKVETSSSRFSGKPSGYTLKTILEGKQFILREKGKEDSVSVVMFGDESRRSASLLYVPIRKGDLVIGVISIQSYNYNAYMQQDLDILDTLAHLCAEALIRIQAQEEMRLSEERLSLAKRFGHIGVWDKDLLTGKITWSDTTYEIFGIKPGEFDGTRDTFLSMVHPEDRQTVIEALEEGLQQGKEYECEHRIILPDNSVRWVVERGNTVFSENGEPLRMLGVCVDVTIRKEAEEQLSKAAFYDSLTSLPNRALFSDRLEQCLAHSKRRTNYHFSVMLLDLDHFKSVNDTMGHLMGDKLLNEAGKRLREIMREGDTVARFGGDEFTILLDDLKENNHAIHIAERVVQEISRPFIINEHEISISASVGIVISKGEYEKSEEILRDADTALYRAKERGGNRFVIFDQQMHESVMAYLDIESGLRSALSNKEFRLYYQPIISVKTGKLCGIEALIRWQHPQKGLLSPNSFIPVSEDSGLIVSIGEWVIRECCRQRALWGERFSAAKDLFVSANLSALQFSSPSIGLFVEDVLAQYNLDPRRLHLEITEASLLDKPERILPILSRWRSKGILILLDDFGTGISPLGRLADFPVDFLKIDRSFISGLDSADESRHIVRAMINLARILNIRVVAEGAETKTQMDALGDMGCEYVQGYYISHPLTSQDMENYLKNTAIILSASENS